MLFGKFPMSRNENHRSFFAGRFSEDRRRDLAMPGSDTPNAIPQNRAPRPADRWTPAHTEAVLKVVLCAAVALCVLAFYFLGGNGNASETDAQELAETSLSNDDFS